LVVGLALQPGSIGKERQFGTYLLSKMSPDARHALLTDLYGPSGLRLSVGRTCIGTSDFSTKMYSYDDAPDPDPDLKHFSIDEDRMWIIPALREAQEINPDLYLFSCVWSPPGLMKRELPMR
jgi:glucosylceramidase